jgi:septum site-determining protein MinD|uniref:septum site-determining protein n=1 Tax=Cryptomonas gyropyrenoidosa TaxID=233257 RepID=UPI0027A04044|nr:septum site-determining protein [Cryptomonas gyropyrenoidosa]WFQ82933.1 septum site-determining protein [Cryptomonas gyropyrenoidosa]
MSRVIVITSGKGGVGKTTVTANLGMSLARLGYKTIVVDADIGLRNLDLLLGLENRVIYTILEVLSGECSLEQALIKDKRQPNLSLLPAAQNRNKDCISCDQIRNLMSILEKVYEYILIDCPAGIETGFHNAISSAREAIVVTTPEIAAVRDADRVIGLLEANGIQKIFLLLNRFRPEMVKSNDMMSVEDVREILAIPLLGVIPEDESVIVSTNRGEPLVLGKKISLPGLAFENMAYRLEGQNVDFINFDLHSKNPLKRIKNFFLGPTTT